MKEDYLDFSDMVKFLSRIKIGLMSAVKKIA